jgi:Putative transposase/Transposase zinc-binding domain
MNFKGIKNKILRFKRIFTDHWSSFVRTHPRYDTDYYQAEVSKMQTCGSEAGGFAIFQCLRCGEDERKVHFSCKGKACPQCGKRYARDSMIKIAARLYPGVGYRQIVLTLPEQLRCPFYNHPNQHKLYSQFMALAQPCLEELIQGLFKNTDYKAATIAFLHTNGRNGNYNPHLHVIVAEGAFHPTRKEWRAFNYLSLGPIRQLWQKYLLTMVAAEFVELSCVVDQLWVDYPDGFYVFPGNNNRVPTRNYKGLIRYLTKYLSAPPIGVSKIVDYDGENVKYYYQSHRTKSRAYETINVQTFIGRMVQHILPKGFQRVRYYGLHATATFKKWYEVIAGVAGDLVDAMVSYVNRITYIDFFAEVAKRNPLMCKHCGAGMDLVRCYHPDRGVFYDLLAYD